ncbi:DivIVA domain-containing protein [Dactylosporangium sp. NPDC005555]
MIEFEVVLRGYRPADVDALLGIISGALVSGDAARRADAVRASMTSG